MQDFLDATVQYSDRWYSFWQMIGALGTVGAVVVALTLGRRDSKLRSDAQKAELSRLERERDEARRLSELQARRAQAEQIHFWIAPTKWDTIYAEGPPGERELVDWVDGKHLVLRNASAVPVISPTIHYTFPRLDKKFAYDGDRDALLPSTQFEAFSPLDLDDATGFAEFRDVNSVWWRRWGDGRLEEIEAPTA